MKLLCRRMIFVCLLCIGSVSWAANTYYISPSGSDITGSGSSSNPWATLSKAFKSMLGGDTLVCKDGTYKGDLNRVYYGGSGTQYPPFGSSGAWTTVKAENPGMAVFDGEEQRAMFYYAANLGALADQNCYWIFDGLVWCRTAGSPNVLVTQARYVKLLNCGGFDCGDGSTNNFYIRRSTYVLLEGCYSYGTGRYKFEPYQSSKIILRNCVGRTDRHDFAATPDVLAGFSIYSCDDVEVQNCIQIDSDQPDKYIKWDEISGAFCVPSTDKNANNITFNRCVGLNNYLGGLFTTGNEYYAAYNVTFKDCVIWRSSRPDGGGFNNVRGVGTVISNCTFGDNSSNGYFWFNGYDAVGYDNSATLKNSIVFKFLGTSVMLRDFEIQDYNAFFQNSNTTGRTGSHDILDVNPIYSPTNTSGALKYIIKIEPTSNLSGKGLGGADIGANISTLIGTPGSLWGEPGYNTDTDISMWPFPNEALIRTKMRSYTGGGVNGARGFCADGQSLTKYIWGYLGNEAPAEFTGSIEGKVVNSRGQGVAGISMVIAGGISDTAATDSSGEYAFAGLTIGADYTITPVKEGYTFNPPNRTITDFSAPSTGLHFVASGLAVGDVVKLQELRVVGSSSQQGTVNPTKGDTAKIYFQGTTTGTYECRIFNINRVLVWHDKKEGVNSDYFEWFPKDMPSGAYIVNVQGPGFNQTKKMAVLK